VLIITDRRLYACRRKWLRETERSRLNGVERAMPSSNNRLLASLSSNDFDLLGPQPRMRDPRAAKESRKTQQAN
jgi:hypothetical protein